MLKHRLVSGFSGDSLLFWATSPPVQSLGASRLVGLNFKHGLPDLVVVTPAPALI